MTIVTSKLRLRQLICQLVSCVMFGLTLSAADNDQPAPAEMQKNADKIHIHAIVGSREYKKSATTIPAWLEELQHKYQLRYTVSIAADKSADIPDLAPLAEAGHFIGILSSGDGA